MSGTAKLCGRMSAPNLDTLFRAFDSKAAEAPVMPVAQPEAPVAPVGQ